MDEKIIEIIIQLILYAIVFFIGVLIGFVYGTKKRLIFNVRKIPHQGIICTRKDKGVNNNEIFYNICGNNYSYCNKSSMASTR